MVNKCGCQAMAYKDPNNGVALPDGARSPPLRLALCPADSGADSRRDRGTSQDPYQTPKALARSAQLTAAMVGSRSGEVRARRKRIAGGAGRPIVVMDVSRADVVPIGQGGPEPSNRHEVLNDFLHSELYDGLRLVEHGE